MTASFQSDLLPHKQKHWFSCATV